MTRSFGAALRQLRLGAGITQATLAARAGVSERTIQELERDAVRPRRDTVRRLIAALDPPPEARAELEGVTPTPRRRRAEARGTRDRRLSELPLLRAPLIGREREMAEIRALLLDADVALVTLTGTGGVGKTRLALQVAAGLVDRFGGGVHFVELSPLVDPTLVLSTIAKAVGAPTHGTLSVPDALRAHLRGRAVLLVLDNLEQILSAGPDVANLLATTPELKVIVTSREPLRLRDEHEYAVPPLALPDPDHPLRPDALADFGAVAFFVERASTVRADFALTDENAASVVEICARLDGLALAIELAAARVRTLTLRGIAARLDRRLPFLTGGPRDGPARQRTLRDAIAWSYDLLDDAERRLFRRLAIFVGGWTLEAAEAVCTVGDDGADVLDGLDSLVSKSLVRRHEDAHDEPRFGMLETIREYAIEQLELSGQAPIAQQRHAEYYLGLAESSEPMLRSSAKQGRWLARLDMEYENLRAALTWCQADTCRAGIGLRLAGALYWFWQVRGYVSEGRRWLEQVLTSEAEGASPSTRTRAMWGLASLVRRQGDYAQARALYEDALSLSRTSNDLWGVARGHGELGIVARHQGDFSQATMLLEKSLAYFQQLQDSWGMAFVLGNLGQLAQLQNDGSTAAKYYRESLALARRRGDQIATAWVLRHLGNVVFGEGEFENAATLYEESLALFRALGDLAGVAFALTPLADLAQHQGEYARAHALHTETLSYAWRLGDSRRIATSLEGLAVVTWAQQEPKRATRLFSAADALRESIGVPLPSSQCSRNEAALGAAAETLGESVFAAAWAEGRAMTLEQAIAYALDEQPSA